MGLDCSNTVVWLVNHLYDNASLVLLFGLLCFILFLAQNNIQVLDVSFFYSVSYCSQKIWTLSLLFVCILFLKSALIFLTLLNFTCKFYLQFADVRWAPTSHLFLLPLCSTRYYIDKLYVSKVWYTCRFFTILFHAMYSYSYSFMLIYKIFESKLKI